MRNDCSMSGIVQGLVLRGAIWVVTDAGYHGKCLEVGDVGLVAPEERGCSFRLAYSAEDFLAAFDEYVDVGCVDGFRSEDGEEVQETDAKDTKKKSPKEKAPKKTDK